MAIKDISEVKSLLSYGLSGDASFPNGEKVQDILDYTGLKEPLIDIAGELAMPEGVEFDQVKELYATGKQAVEYYAPQVQAKIDEIALKSAEKEVAKHEARMQSKIEKIEAQNQKQIEKLGFGKFEPSLESEIDEIEIELEL